MTIVTVSPYPAGGPRGPKYERDEFGQPFWRERALRQQGWYRAATQRLLTVRQAPYMVLEPEELL